MKRLKGHEVPTPTRPQRQAVGGVLAGSDEMWILSVVAPRAPLALFETTLSQPTSDRES
jgi:hypothetical protein